MNERPSIANSRLYGILDLGYVARDKVIDTARALASGPESCRVDILQLRAKNVPVEDVQSMAAELLPVTRDSGIPFIINDHPKIAAAVGSEGVHVGQADLGVEEVRAIVGPDAIVGKSTHSLDQAMAAAEEDIDYIGFGPLFATPTKPGRPAIGLEDVSTAHQRLSSGFPVFCIGGIKLENLPEVLAAGARRIVVVSGILDAGDIPARISRLKALLPPRA